MFSIEVVQHPIRARMCGFGEKDRRPIDPPPVVKLIPENPGENPKNIYERSLLFVVHCDLFNINEKDPTMPPTHPSSQIMSPGTPATYVRNLVGSLVSSPTYLVDDKNEPGVFFLFSDLSVRTEGTFRLQFTLFAIDDSTTSTPAASIQFSNPFMVFPPKKFPGMTDSTELSKAFARQGVKIAIRKSDKGSSQVNSIGLENNQPNYEDGILEEEEEEEEE